MIYIKKNGIVTNSGQGQEWLDKHIALGTFGLAAYSYQQETSPAVLNEQGMEISPATYETINVPAEYEVIDVPDQEDAISQARAFLTDSDWKRMRHISQKALGVPTSLTEEDYLEMELQCQTYRDQL